MITRARSIAVLFLVFLFTAPPLGRGMDTSQTAQTDEGKQTGEPSPAPPAQGDPAAPLQNDQDDEDRTIDPSQPDFTIVNLPTNLRLPSHKSAFRVAHRFGRPLGQGDFGDLVEDLFGLDSGALIALEYRFGIVRGGQIGIFRTSAKTIQFFGQYDFIRQDDDTPFGVGAMVTIEGLDNFKEEYSPGINMLLSRKLGERGALYVEPMFVGNTNLFFDDIDDSHTFLVGLGARLRISDTVYLVGEFSPRIAGYDPGVHHGTFGIEKRAGGHLFQINFSNSFGMTMAEIARGGNRSDDWFIGFNITRKFY